MKIIGHSPMQQKESLKPPTLVGKSAQLPRLRIDSCGYGKLPNAACGPVITDSSIEFPGVVRSVEVDLCSYVGVTGSTEQYKREISGERMTRSLV